MDKSDFALGFDAGWEAAIQYLRRWPKAGPHAPYFGSAQHYADALNVERSCGLDIEMFSPRLRGLR